MTSPTSPNSPTPRDRYGGDVLATDWRRPPNGRTVEVPAEVGLVVEEVTTDWCGEIVVIDRDLDTVTLEDRRDRRRTFPLGPGFLLEGRPVSLTRPVRASTANGPVLSASGRPAAGAGAAAGRTASGSVAVTGERARVAAPSRIFVEGRHDAELVEKVWGADLRVEGVVVEYLAGVDDLAEHLRAFGPGPSRRAGVLVDHLVPGSKESRIADAVARSPIAPHVRVVGHPFIDVWAAVKPARVGLERWPDVPRSEEWKQGVCRRLGWPHESARDLGRAWQHILGRVSGYQDLEPALLGRVEELIDFVTAP